MQLFCRVVGDPDFFDGMDCSWAEPERRRRERVESLTDHDENTGATPATVAIRSISLERSDGGSGIPDWFHLQRCARDSDLLRCSIRATLRSSPRAVSRFGGRV